MKNRLEELKKEARQKWLERFPNSDGLYYKTWINGLITTIYTQAIQDAIGATSGGKHNEWCTERGEQFKECVQCRLQALLPQQ